MNAMTHIADDELLALLDGELSDERAAEVRQHLGTCSRCAAALAVLDASARQLTAALAWIDRPSAELELTAIIEKKESRGKRRLARGALFRAAALLLMIAGASAAAIPGSPVRDWVVRSLDDMKAWFGHGAAVTNDAAPVQDISGVTVTAFDDRVRISLSNPAPDARVRVVLVDGDEGSVRASGARYRTGPGWIEVLGPTSEEIQIELPRSVSAARVEVNGQLALLKDGLDLRLVMPVADSTGSEIVFRVNR